jgi:hypothetical protein
MGTSEALPFAVIWRTATARGPASFFLGTLRSPGVICGRSSCAALLGGTQTADASATISAPQYKIFWNTGWQDREFLRETPMNINDKAPDFILPDENGKEVALKDLRGKTVILFFYPRANTPG